MAGSVNKVILIGNLGKDPDVRRLENGTAVASFPIATSESYKDRNGNRVDSTEWHNIVMWRGLAEIAEKYLRKGSSIYVEGKLKTRSWEDQDRNTRYITEVVADNMTMLGSRSDSGASQQQAPTPSQEPAGTYQASSNNTSAASTNAAGGDQMDDDLPF